VFIKSLIIKMGLRMITVKYYSVVLAFKKKFPNQIWTQSFDTHGILFFVLEVATDMKKLNASKANI
jgi:hypothetical protein